MIRYFIDKDRPFRDVPGVVTALLAVSLAAQLVWRSQQEPPVARAEDLPHPMPHRAYVTGSFGEPIAAAKILNQTNP